MEDQPIIDCFEFSIQFAFFFQWCEFSIVLDNLKKLRKNDIKFGISLTLNSSNIDSIKEVSKSLISLGANGVCINMIKNVSDDLIKKMPIEKQTEALKDLKYENGKWYEAAVEHLKSIDLYEDNGYKFGSDWLYESIPHGIIEEVKHENCSH